MSLPVSVAGVCANAYDNMDLNIWANAAANVLCQIGHTTSMGFTSMTGGYYCAGCSNVYIFGFSESGTAPPFSYRVP